MKTFIILFVILILCGCSKSTILSKAGKPHIKKADIIKITPNHIKVKSDNKDGYYWYHRSEISNWDEIR